MSFWYGHEGIDFEGKVEVQIGKMSRSMKQYNM